MKVFYHTFGCKVNQYETENIRQALTKLGFETSYDLEDSDIYVINSCAVTSRSEQKCIQFLNKIRRINPSSIIILTGCMAQVSESSDKIDADIITGTSEKGKIPTLLNEYLKSKAKTVEISPHFKGESFEKMVNFSNEDKTRAYIKIQDGCDMFCSYCIIPYARGRIRSKALVDITNEARQLIISGHKEIILTGINLSCYGKDLEENINLTDAIEAICELSSDIRVRLGSLEPELISDNDIERLRRLSNFCPQFHLSLQSGCDGTLKRMNRKYTSSDYRELVSKLRNSFENVSITTDIMVGFPDETQEDFLESLNFVKEIGFSKVHIFPYSRRKGTVADRMENQIPENEKEKRAKRMEEVAKLSENEFLESMVGKVVKVLFEKSNSEIYHHGYSENYTLINVLKERPTDNLRREIRNVIITKALDGYCLGEIIE